MLDPKFVVIAELIAFFLSSFFLWNWLLAPKSVHPPLPPGPRKLPLIGNAFQAPSSKEWETYAKWGQEYGCDELLSLLSI
jgi:hypothetical protein